MIECKWLSKAPLTLPPPTLTDAHLQSLPREERIALAQKALRGENESVGIGVKLSYREAGKRFGVSKSALQARHTGKHVARPSAQPHLHTEPEEAALVDWREFLAQTAHPLTRKTVNPVIKRLCGRAPGKHWLRKSLKRHAQRSVVWACFWIGSQARASFELADDFPPICASDADLREVRHTAREHLELGEKGVQLNGCRKGSHTKYILLHHSCSKYKTSNANLELVTVMECVNAVGDWMPPSIVFEGQQLMNRWFQNENIGAGRWERTCFDTCSADRAPVSVFHHMDGLTITLDSNGLKKSSFRRPRCTTSLGRRLL